MTIHSAVSRLIHGSFTIERIYPQAPARVFAAFSDPELKARWFYGPSPWKLIERKLEFRPGGEELAHGTFGDGNETIFRARYSDIQPDARIVFTYDMSWQGAHRSTSLCGMEFLAEGSGTRLVLTEVIMFLDGEDGTESRQWGVNRHLETIAGVL